MGAEMSHHSMVRKTWSKMVRSVHDIQQDCDWSMAYSEMMSRNTIDGRTVSEMQHSIDGVMSCTR
jgi:hypothetical protein